MHFGKSWSSAIWNCSLLFNCILIPFCFCMIKKLFLKLRKDFVYYLIDKTRNLRGGLNKWREWLNVFCEVLPLISNLNSCKSLNVWRFGYFLIFRKWWNKKFIHKLFFVSKQIETILFHDINNFNFCRNTKK